MSKALLPLIPFLVFLATLETTNAYTVWDMAKVQQAPGVELSDYQERVKTHQNRDTAVSVTDDIIIEDTSMSHTMDQEDPLLATEYADRNRSANADYAFRHPTGHNLLLNDIVFKNDTDIYTVGRIGTVYFSNDRGNSWEFIETPFNIRLHAIDVYQERIIVVGNEGLIATSDDAGQNWAIKDSGTEVNLRDIFVTDNGDMYISGNSKTLLYSEDLGQTWETIEVPDDAIHNPHDRPNWNFQSIWVEGDIIMLGTGLPGIPIQIVRSTNHGEDWESVLPEGVDQPAANLGAYLSDFAFADDGLTGYASYWMLFNNGVAKTTDGGATWKKIEELEEFTPFPNPEIEYTSTEIYFRQGIDTSSDGQTVITSGSFGQILASTDGGDTWEEIFGGPHYGDRYFRSVAFMGVAISPDEEKWISTGSRGLIVGASDFEIASATIFNGEERPRIFIDMAFLDENKGIAVGSQEAQKYFGSGAGYYVFYDGLYFTTEDGGDTWQETDGPGKENHEWFDVATNGENQIWTAGVRYEYHYNEDDELVVVRHAVISHSDDGGDTWEEQIAIPGRNITAITLWDEDHIYAATDGNTFLRSLNGEDWESLELPEEIVSGNHIRSIELISPRILFAGGGGNDAFIYQSTDAGENWEQVSLQTAGSGAINHVSFVDAKHGIAGGRWGTFMNYRNLLYTSDYGESWDLLTSDGPWQDYLQVYYIAMLDSATAFAYGHNGGIIEIEDGESFSPTRPFFTEEALLGGVFNGTQQLFLSGTGGTIAAYTSDDPPPSAPARFANTFPIDGEDIFIPWDSDAVFTWEEAVDHDGGPVTYVMILEDEHGDEEIFRSPELDQNHFAANTENFPSLPPKLYRWRVKAFNQNGLYSTSYPTKAFVDVDDFINDQNDIVAFSFEQDAEPAEIDTDNHTVNAYVIYGSDISNLTPEIEVSHNATIDPPSGEAQDFSDPVTYTVTAQNEDEQEWLVTVHIADPIDYIIIEDYQQFDYMMMPFSQLRVLDFETDIVNEGHRDVTQVVLSVKINDALAGQSSAIEDLPMGSEATLYLDPAYELTEAGKYDFHYEIGIGEEDPNLVGNTAEAFVELTDSVYATDPGIFSNSLGSNVGPISLANIYQVIHKDNLTSISIGWGANLPASPLNFTFSIHRVNKETLTSEEEVFSSPTLQRFPEQATSIVSYGFPKIELDPGYYAIVLNQITSEHIRLAFSDVPEGYFYIYDSEEGSFERIDDETFGFVMLRANFGDYELSSDASLSDLQVEGETIEGFDPTVFEYTYTLTEDVVETPEITAKANDEGAHVEITPASDVTSADEEDRTTVVEVTAEDGETNLVYRVLFESTTSIEELSAMGLKVYPNPARDYIHITLEKTGKKVLQVTSLKGEVYMTLKIERNSYHMDVSMLPAGLYLLSVVYEGQVFSETFSVVR